MEPLNTISSIDVTAYYQQSPRKMFRQARSLFRKNRIHDAIAILKALLKQGHDPVSVQGMIAQCYDRLSFLTRDIECEDLAKLTYEKLLGMDLKRRQKRRIQKEYDRFINRIYELGEPDYKAFMKARQLRNREIKTPKAWMMLGSNFNIRKDVDFVINAYKNALELDPQYILALYKTGYVLQYNKQDADAALPYYVRVIKTDPESDENESLTTNARCILDACNQLGKLYYARGEYRKVVAVFNHALKTQAAYLPQGVLLSIRELIYLADHSSTQLNLKERLDGHLRAHFDLTLTLMVQKYCKNISVA